MATELYEIPGSDRKTSVAEIIFIHGLKPGPDNQQEFAFSTWGGKDKNSDFWAKWLREDLVNHEDGALNVTTWVLQYDSAATDLFGGAMPIYDRAGNILDRLNGRNFGKKPIIFVGHSMGGLIAKEVIRRGLTGGVSDYEVIAKSVRGIAFISTPHSVAFFPKFISNLKTALRITDPVIEMSANSATMRSLSEWYSNNSLNNGVDTLAYGENYTQFGVMVVDQTSANPQVQGKSFTLLDANHSDTAKPTKNTDQQCEGVLRFVSRVIRRELNTPFA